MAVTHRGRGRLGQERGLSGHLPGDFPSRLLVFSSQAVEDDRVRSAGDIPPPQPLSTPQTPRSAEGRKPPQRAALLQRNGVCADPSSAAGLSLRRHAPPALAAPGAQMHRASRIHSSHRTGRPAELRHRGLDLGGQAQASPAACPCPLPDPQPAQLWGEENSSFPWEPEEESFWGCGWDCASLGGQRDPSAAVSPLRSGARLVPGRQPRCPRPERCPPWRGVRRGSSSPPPELCQTRSDI